MPCYKPLQAYKAKFEKTANGKSRIYFGKNSPPVSNDPIEVPCGRCIGCRLERTRQWAVRIVHEASLHNANSFLTLTYAPEHLPYGGTLVKPHLQNFFKRLRRRLEPKRVRYFAAGEYGDKRGRPHYHVCLFGEDFSADRVKVGESKGYPLFQSRFLSEVWKYGDHFIGDVSHDSAGYTAQYCVKKINGDMAQDHYSRIVESTGELIQLEPEFMVCSLKPGIGQGWYERYREDFERRGTAVYKGREMRAPKFYDKLHERFDPESFERVKAERIAAAEADLNNSPERLAVRERIAKARLSLQEKSL